MKFLAVGDDFIPSSLFEEIIRKNLRDIDEKIEFSRFDYDRNAPLDISVDDVREYWGDPRDVISRSQDVNVIVTSFAPINRQVIDSSPNLKIIGCSRGGPLNINVEYATKKKIPVLYTPGRNADAVADYTLGLILNITRKILDARDYVKRGDWKTYQEDTFEKPTGHELNSQTLGIIGLGEVGRRVAKRAASFGMRIIVYDPFLSKKRVIELGFEPASLNDLLRVSDVVTIHARLTSGSKKLIGERELSLMKRSSYIINTSRGIALDENALYKALKECRIAGAALDVVESEPIKLNNPLLTLDNVIITPHAAGVSQDIPRRSCEMLAEDLKRYFKGETPRFVFNSILFDEQE